MDSPPSPPARGLLAPWLGFLSIAALMVGRIPVLFFVPRFWWDDGKISYKYAYENGWLDVLFAPHQGYYSIINNLTALAQSRLLPIETAPMLGVWVSLVVQLLPHAVIWFGVSRYWRALWQKALASGLVLYLTHDCTLWYTVCTLQFHMSLLVFLILAEDWQGRRQATLRSFTAMLGLSSFSGAVPCFLAPFFVWRAWRERSRQAMLLGGVMLAGCAVQLAAIVWSHFFGTLIGNIQRTDDFSLAGLMPIYALETAKALVGTAWLEGVTFKRPGQWASVVLPYLAAMVYFSKPLPMQGRVLFVGSSLTLSVMSLLFGLEIPMRGRYYFAANAIFLFMVAQNILHGSAVRKMLAQALMAAALAGSVQSYYSSFKACYQRDWPDWRTQVEAWKEDTKRPIQTHPPIPFWNMYLLPRGDEAGVVRP